MPPLEHLDHVDALYSSMNDASDQAKDKPIAEGEEAAEPVD
jgi:hypothetical protein